MTGEIKTVKQPHYIRRQDGRVFCFAGLMAVWHKPDSSAARLSCAILTTAASGPLAEVHERMPVVLPDNAHAGWLDARLVEPAQITAIAREPAAPHEFIHYTVRKLVNSSRAEGAELIEPGQASS